MMSGLLRALARYDSPPVITWPASGPAHAYVVEFSIDEFKKVWFTSSDHLPELTSQTYSIPDWAWKKAPWFRTIHWRVLAEMEHHKIELYRGTMHRLTGKRLLLLLVNILRRAPLHHTREISGGGIGGTVVHRQQEPTGRPQVNSLEDLPHLPEPARGYFGNVFWKDGQLHGNGWMLLPETRIDGIDVFIDAAYVTTVPVFIHDTLPEEFSFILHAMRSVFQFSIEREWPFPDKSVDICLLGYRKGRHVCSMETAYCPEWKKMIVLPPAHLMKRIANNENPDYYRTSAMKSYRDYFSTAQRFISFETVEKVLDWGCGVGRMLGLASRIHPEWKFYGCDVDREAVNWCRSNIENAVFDVAPLMPPSQYEDNTFSLVIANSVLTHLDRETEKAWLSEIRRIMVPNGIFLASLHGEFAWTFFQRDSGGHYSKNRLRRKGIIDDIRDSVHSGVTPDGYYRATFQSKEYSMGLLSRYFTLLEYVERGAMNLQDLVVLKKEPDKGE